jgi:type IV secretion system protein VirB10
VENEETKAPPEAPAEPETQQPPTPPTPPPDLDLRPQPKIKRLNRVAILLVAIVAIVVLWAAYFVLSSRPPIGRQEGDGPRSGLQQQGLAVERLQKSALSRQAEVEPLFRPRPEPPKAPAPVTPARRQTRPPTDPGHARLERAYDADVLAPAFTRSRPARGLATDVDGFSADLQTHSGQVLTAARGDDQAAPPAEAFQQASGGGDPGLLARKDNFLRSAQAAERSAYLPSTVQEPLSPYELKEGTLIPAILLTGINSELPGQTQALVHSTTGRYLLIPQGSRLIGEYDNRIAWGQKRVLLAWHRLIFPDGRSLDLRGMPGADLAAMAGIRDKVNNHFVRTFGSALLLSAITAGVQLSQPQDSSFGATPSASQIAAAALGQEIGRVTAEITRRNVDLQPTLEIRPGYLFNVEITADVILPPLAN